MNKNCLSYWFPKLERSGVPVPRTTILHDGENLVAQIEHASADYGYPFFLRTGQESGKHSWDRTCFVRSADAIRDHVAALFDAALSEWREMVDFLGLESNVWVVREYLPVEPIATVYRGMPLVAEARSFIGGGKILCSHPYWPADAIRKGMTCPHGTLGKLDDDECALCDDLAKAYFAAADLTMREPEWRPIVESVAAAFADDGAWSVDVIHTQRGYFITDMAEMARSFHWAGCPNEEGPVTP